MRPTRQACLLVFGKSSRPMDCWHSKGTGSIQHTDNTQTGLCHMPGPNMRRDWYRPTSVELRPCFRHSVPTGCTRQGAQQIAGWQPSCRPTTHVWKIRQVCSLRQDSAETNSTGESKHNSTGRWLARFKATTVLGLQHTAPQGSNNGATGRQTTPVSHSAPEAS